MQELMTRAGDQIVITKSVGLSGTYALFRERYEELHSRYAVDFLEEIAAYPDAFSLEPEYAVLEQQTWSACVEASYGGIFGALFRLGYDSGLGLRVELPAIPIRQQVIETAAYFEINPYLLHSAGSLVVACPNSFPVVRALRTAGIPAVTAGELTEDKARIVCVQEDERFLTPPRRDALLHCFSEAYVKAHFPKTIVTKNGNTR